MRLRAQTILVRNNEEKKPLGRCSQRWEDIIKVYVLKNYIGS